MLRTIYVMPFLKDTKKSETVNVVRIQAVITASVTIRISVTMMISNVATPSN
jgi:hypothetical protein